MSYADRAEASADPSYPLDKVYCARRLWVNLELGGWDPEEVRDEINEKRIGCEGYLKYKPGWTPSGHKELLTKREDLKIQIALLVLGIVLGGIGTLVFQRISGD